MAKAAKKDLKTAKTSADARSARRANTRERAERATRKMAAREPVVETQSLRPTRDIEGLQKIARLMSGLSLRAANAYADARMGEGDKYVRIAAAGYREAMGIFDEIIKANRVLKEAEREHLITVMNGIKLLHVRIQDYNVACKDEAWRREHQEEWNPHPLGEDKQGFFAKERF